jgi:4-hydroxy-4-methyl-2-oxoglutarate aldolase
MKLARVLMGVAALAALFAVFGFTAADAPVSPADPVIAGFRKTTVASVADAVDQVVGERGFLSHDMRPRVEGQIVGRALTVLIKPAPPEKATATLSVKHSVDLIDNAKPGEVPVIVIEDGLDIAGIGGLMATTAKARNLAGVVVDGGARDIAEIRALGLPVYSRSVTSATTVGRYASVASQTPVRCAGVVVKPGDIIVAGEDGVVRVPKEKAAEVLKRAEEIDARETKMVPYILKFKSLTKVVQMFNRI